MSTNRVITRQRIHEYLKKYSCHSSSNTTVTHPVLLKIINCKVTPLYSSHSSTSRFVSQGQKKLRWSMCNTNKAKTSWICIGRMKQFLRDAQFVGYELLALCIMRMRQIAYVTCSFTFWETSWICLEEWSSFYALHYSYDANCVSWESSNSHKFHVHSPVMSLDLSAVSLFQSLASVFWHPPPTLLQLYPFMECAYMVRPIADTAAQNFCKNLSMDQNYDDEIYN